MYLCNKQKNNDYEQRDFKKEHRKGDYAAMYSKPLGQTLQGC